MDLYEVTDQIVEILQQRGRLTYRVLKLQFNLDDETLEALKDELLFSYPVVDEDGRGLVWTGDVAPEPAPTRGPTEQATTELDRDPASYTPQHLAEKILTSRSTLQGERKQVTVMFADIKDSTELIRDLDPEAAQQLLDPAIHIMMDAVHRFEGTVNQKWPIAVCFWTDGARCMPELLWPSKPKPTNGRMIRWNALRGELWEKALTYFRQAGFKARAQSANREAVACFEQALDALQQLPESHDRMSQVIDLFFELRTALHSLGELRRVLDYLRAAERLAEILDDRRRLGRVASYLTSYFFRTGDLNQALIAGQRSLDLATICGDATLQVAASYHLGLVHYHLGDYGRAIALHREIVASLKGDMLHERFGLPGFASVSLRMALARCLGEQGAFAEGISRGEEGVRIAEAADDPDSLCRIYLGVNQLYLLKGDLSKAMPRLEQCLLLCQGANMPLLSPEAASLLGYAYLLSGRVAEALPLLKQAVEQATAMNVMNRQSIQVSRLSEAYLLTGRTEETIDLAERALELALAHKERGNQAWVLRLLGDIAMYHDPPDFDQAETDYQQALALAKELGMRPLQAHCHRGLGTLYSQRGHAEQSRTELSTAIEITAIWR